MQSFEPGTVLYVQFTGFKHYGLYIGDGLVIQNARSTGEVKLVNLLQFSCNKEIHVSTKIQPKDPAQAIENAKQHLGRKYNVVTDNCEHFVREMCGMGKNSHQVRNWVFGAVGIGLAAAARRHPAIAAASLLVTAGAIIHQHLEKPNEDPKLKHDNHPRLPKPNKNRQKPPQP